MASGGVFVETDYGPISDPSRPEDVERNAAIMQVLAGGMTWADIVKATGASRSTLSKLAKRVKRKATA